MNDRQNHVWYLAEQHPEVRQAYGAPNGVPLVEHVKKLTWQQRREAAKRLLNLDPRGGAQKTR